jgi:hypothetical protein
MTIMTRIVKFLKHPLVSQVTLAVLAIVAEEVRRAQEKSP